MIKIDMQQFRAGIKQKVDQVNEASRPAAQSGAQVVYDRARTNVINNNSISSKGHWFHGTMYKVNGKKYWFEPRTLLNSIYQVFSRRNSSTGISTYHISYNMTDCPYAHLVEYGTSRSNAHPFIGPAIHNHQTEVEQAMVEEFTKRMAV